MNESKCGYYLEKGCKYKFYAKDVIQFYAKILHAAELSKDIQFKFTNLDASSYVPEHVREVIKPFTDCDVDDDPYMIRTVYRLKKHIAKQLGFENLESGFSKHISLNAEIREISNKTGTKEQNSKKIKVENDILTDDYDIIENVYAKN